MCVEHQRLSRFLPNGVDLSPEAVGHWGVDAVFGAEFFGAVLPSGEAVKIVQCAPGSFDRNGLYPDGCESGIP